MPAALSGSTFVSASTTSLPMSFSFSEPLLDSFPFPLALLALLVLLALLLLLVGRESSGDLGDGTSLVGSSPSDDGSSSVEEFNSATSENIEGTGASRASSLMRSSLFEPIVPSKPSSPNSSSKSFDSSEDGL